LEIPKAIVIYQTDGDDIRLVAERIKKRLEDVGMEVAVSQDKDFKDFKSIDDFNVIALGSSCLSCRNCHGAAECRAPKKLRKRLKKLFKMDLSDKKLITFASSADSTKNEWIYKRIENLIAPTKIKLVTSIGCVGKPQDNFDTTLKQALQKKMFE
jgi:flavodoxin